MHAEDRGFQFADARLRGVRGEGRPARRRDAAHAAPGPLARASSASPQPMAAGAWSRVMRETIRRNRVRDGLVYLQVSRGARPRDFLFPPDDVKPTVVCLARSVSPARLEAAAAEPASPSRPMPDTRWARCDIKTVMLLPASLAKEAARGEGAQGSLVRRRRAAMSPRAPPRMPGSSTRRGGSSPARSTTPSCAASRARR